MNFRNETMTMFTVIADQINLELPNMVAMKAVSDELSQQEIYTDLNDEIVASIAFDVNQAAIDDREFFDHCVKEFVRGIVATKTAMDEIVSVIVFTKVIKHHGMTFTLKL